MMTVRNRSALKSLKTPLLLWVWLTIASKCNKLCNWLTKTVLRWLNLTSFCQSLSRRPPKETKEAPMLKELREQAQFLTFSKNWPRAVYRPPLKSKTYHSNSSFPENDAKNCSILWCNLRVQPSAKMARLSLTITRNSWQSGWPAQKSTVEILLKNPRPFIMGREGQEPWICRMERNNLFREGRQLLRRQMYRMRMSLWAFWIGKVNMITNWDEARLTQTNKQTYVKVNELIITDKMNRRHNLKEITTHKHFD